MAGRAVFVSNWRGVIETLNEDDAVKYMQGVVETITRNVIAQVPVDSGAYLAGFEQTLRLDVHTDEQKGAVGTVGTTSPLYHIIEFGTIKNPGGYHPFGLGVLRSGLAFTPTGRGPKS